MTPRQLAALLFLAATWGGSFLYVRVLVDAGVEPLGVSAIRTGVGVATLLPFAVWARDQFPRDARTWLALCVLGVTNFIAPWTLVAISQQHIPSGVASIVNSAMPLWTAIFTVILLRADPLRPAQCAGLLLGFLGVVALLGDDLRHLSGDSTAGVGAMLFATAMAGISTVSIRRWMGHVAPIALTVGQVGSAAALLLPVAIGTGAYSGVHFGLPEIASAAAVGAVGSGVAVVAFMWLIADAGAVRASVVTYVVPPIGVFLGWAILDEPIGWSLVIGLALVAAGVALVQGVAGRFGSRAGRFGRAPLPVPPE